MIMQIQHQTENKKLKIGSVELDSKVILAPMAGITDSILRQLVRLYTQKSLVVSEMVSSEALKWNKDRSIIQHDKTEYPLAFQISGHKPEFMASAAKELEPIATIIDINMGCPAPKIVNNFDGAKLMTDFNLASKIISSVKNSVNIPVTVKCRLGWDSSSKNYLEFARMAEDSGADAITVHGRTRSQQYSGIADWHAIAEVKNTVKIPVIGNGDITSPQKALECLNISNCDGIAVGRAILGDPEIIYRIEHYLETGNILPEMELNNKIDIALLHSKKEAELRGEVNGIKFMRKFFGWYIKGIRGATKYRLRLVQMETLSEVVSLFDEIKSNV